MDLSIIIVNYNVKEFLQNLIHSIEKASARISKEIIVVDNDSDDGSVEFLRDKFPQIKIIANKTNLGFGKANNIGMAQAKGNYFLLINPDTIVAEDTFDKMINFFNENPEVGLAGCKIINGDGSFYLACRRSFPGPWTSLTKLTGLSSLFPKNKLFARYNLTYLSENETYEVDAVSGAFMMLRNEVYKKVGGFDEDFFMYGEDLDLCYRIQKSGYKVYYVPTTQIIHYQGESTRRSSIDETKLFYNAMHLFVKKHLSSSFFVSTILRVAIALRNLIAFIAERKLILFSILFDFLIFNICLFISEKSYLQISTWGGFPEFAIPIVYTIPAIIQILSSAAIGNYKRNRLSVTKTIISILISLPILTSLTFFFKDFAFSRAVVLITYFFVLILLPLWRIIAKLVLKVGLIEDILKSYRTLLVGLDDSSFEIGKKLKKKKTDKRTIVGLIGFSNKDLGINKDTFEVVGTDQNIVKVIRENKINEIIFSSTGISYNKMMEIVGKCKNENVDFKVVGSNLDFIIGKTDVSLLDDVPLLEFNYNISKPQVKFLKALFDYALAIPSLFLIYPFIYFKQKVTNKQSDFTKFVLGLPKVIFGKVSLVGPSKNEDESNQYLGKKGLTGYWFTESGTTEEIEKLDFYYAKNQNIWMDIEILVKSLNKMWSNK